MRFCRLKGYFDNTDEVNSVGADQNEHPGPLLRVSLQCDVDKTENREVSHYDLDDKQSQQKCLVDLGYDQTIGEVPYVIFVKDEIVVLGLSYLEFLRLVRPDGRLILID